MAEMDMGNIKRDYLERTKRNQFWMGGEQGQLRLQGLKVGVAGLGGMGSNIAEILVRLGVQNLKVADPDIIELSNLNRQVIANLKTIGMKKMDASIAELLNIEPSLKIEKFPDGIRQNNAVQFVDGLDLVINEIDVLHVSEQIHLLEAARSRNIPVYTTLVVGVGVRLYKYDPSGEFTPRQFLSGVLEDPSLESLIRTFAEPLPSYMQAGELDAFKEEVKSRAGIPIFGASTFLGQSLLVIRALADLGYLRNSQNMPKTPALPQFLSLDPLTMEIKTELISSYGNNS